MNEKRVEPQEVMKSTHRCPACHEPLNTQQDHAWFTVWCGNGQCKSEACENGGGGKTENRALAMLLEEHDKEEWRYTSRYKEIKLSLSIILQNEGVSMDLARQEDLIYLCCRFVSDLLTKYVRGQKEHGGDILDHQRNVHKDLYLELIDAVVYHAAEKWQPLVKG